MNKKDKYRISGIFSFWYGDVEMRIEEHLPKEKRYLHAYSRAQAVKMFAIKLEEEFGRKVYLGDSEIQKVDSPKNVKKKKKKEDKQLSLFEDLA